MKLYMCYVILVFPVFISTMRRPYPRGRRNGSGEHRPEPEFTPPGDYIIVEVTALGPVEREEFQPNRSSTPSDLSSTSSERERVAGPSSVPMDLSRPGLPPYTERRNCDSPPTPAYSPLTVREESVSLSSDSVDIVMKTNQGGSAGQRLPTRLSQASTESFPGSPPPNPRGRESPIDTSDISADKVPYRPDSSLQRAPGAGRTLMFEKNWDDATLDPEFERFLAEQEQREREANKRVDDEVRRLIRARGSTRK